MTHANFFSVNTTAEPSKTGLELVCPANSMVTVRAAVDNGADWIHLDYCRHEEMPGLNAELTTIERGIRYAHDKHRKALLAIDIRSQQSTWEQWRTAIDLAARCGFDAILLSEPAPALYAAAQYPQLRLHFAAQDAALNCETIDFFHRRLGVSRVLLPHMLTLAQVARIALNTSVELQVAGFGKHSGIVAGSHVRPAAGQRTRDNSTDAGRCATAEDAANDGCFAFERESDIGTLKLLPQLAGLGISAIKVESRGYGSGQLTQVIRVWREAIDECLENLDHYSVKPSWIAGLSSAAKGRKSG